MANLVDTIFLAVSLDATALRKGVKDTLDVFGQAADGFERHANAFIAGNLNMTRVISDLVTVLSAAATAVAAFAAGMAAAAVNTAKNNQELGNLAAQIDESPDRIKKFFAVIEEKSGSDALKTTGDRLQYIHSQLVALRAGPGSGVPLPETNWLNIFTTKGIFGKFAPTLEPGDKEIDAILKIGDAAKKAGMDVTTVFSTLKIPLEYVRAIKEFTMAGFLTEMDTFRSKASETMGAADQIAHSFTTLKTEFDNLALSFMKFANDLGLSKLFDWLSGVVGQVSDYIGGGSGSGRGGAGYSGGAGISPPSGNLAQDRQKFARELMNNPELRQQLFDLTEAEVGNQGADAKQAFMETVLNRASSRGQSLSQAIHDSSYYPSQTMGHVGSGYGKDASLILRSVMEGSNVSGYATGNASGGVGFDKGPQTFASGGERFGIEGHDAGWAARMRQRDIDSATGLPKDVLFGAYSVLAQGGGSEGLRKYLSSVGVYRDSNWCGDFAAAVFKHAGLVPPKDYAIASNWRNIGPEIPTGQEQPGDVAVRRGAMTGATGSHVGFVSRTEGGGMFDLLAGNQGRAVARNAEARYQFFRPIRQTPPGIPGPGATLESQRINHVDNSTVDVGAVHVNTVSETFGDATIGTPHHTGYTVQDSSASLNMRDFATHPNNSLE